MATRFGEVLLVALLIVVTAGAAFSFMNMQRTEDSEALMREVLVELRKQNEADRKVVYVPMMQGKIRDTGPNINVKANGSGDKANKGGGVKPKGGGQKNVGTDVVKGQGDQGKGNGGTSVVKKPGKVGMGENVVAKGDRGKTHGTKGNVGPKKPTPPVANKKPSVAKPNADDKKAWETYGPTVVKVIEDLFGDRMDDLFARYSIEYAQAQNKATVSKYMKSWRAKNGEFSHILTHRRDAMSEEDSQVFKVVVDTDRNKPMEFTICLDAQKKVTSVFARSAPKGAVIRRDG